MNSILKKKIEEILSDSNVKTPVYLFLCTYYDDYISLESENEKDEYPEELLLEWKKEILVF